MLDTANKVIEAIRKNGYSAYMVGGCVRDMIMGIAPHDIDITTNAKPDEIMSVFSDKETIPTGIKHGTITVIFDNIPFEITTYRIDGEYEDSRHPESVTFTDKIENDLARRDFTINAMAKYKDEIIDVFGGIHDIKNKVIRAVGNPIDRFSEDNLRILRALRFASRYGFKIEKNTLDAMLELSPLVRENISAERIGSEFLKMISGKYFYDVMLVDKQAKVFFNIFPEFDEMNGFNQHSKYHSMDIWKHTLTSVKNIYGNGEILSLSMLFHDFGKPECFSVDESGEGHFYEHPEISEEKTRKFLMSLRFPKRDIDKICILVKNHHRSITSKKSAIKAISLLGYDGCLDLLKIKNADRMAQSDYAVNKFSDENKQELNILNKAYKSPQCVKNEKALCISGNDIIALGVPQGRKIGMILSSLLEAVQDGKVDNEKEQLIDYVKNNFLH